MKTTVRNSIVIGVLLVLAAHLLASWIIGSEVRTAMLNAVETRLPPQSRERISIEELSYQRGLYSSNAAYRVELGILGGLQIPPLELNTTILHGPVLWVDDGIRFAAARFEFAPLTEDNQALQSVSLAMDIGFNQRIDLSLLIEPFEQLDSRNQLRVGETTALAVLHGDQSAEFSLNVERFNLHNPNANLEVTVDALRIKSNTRRLSDIAAPSKVELSIPGVQSSGAINFQLTDFSAAAEVTDSELSSESIDFTQQLRVADLASQWPLQSVNWRFEFEKMPSALVRDYSNMAAELQRRIEGGQPMDAAMMQSALTFGLRLINTDFLVNQTLAVKAHDGEHESALRIEYNGLPELTNLAYLDLNELVAALEIELSLALDLEAVLQSSGANLIDPYVQAGYITIEEGRILLQSSLINSELLLNGEPRTLDEFF